MTIDQLAMEGPFNKGFKPNQHQISLPQQKSDLSDVLTIYESAYTFDWHNQPYAPNAHFRQFEMSMMALPPHSPSQIQHFVNQTISFEREPYYQHITGVTVRCLINNAHSKGDYNSFLLDLRDIKPLHCLGNGLYEQDGRRLRVMVKGEVGDHCFQSIRGGMHYLEEAGDLLGTHSRSGVIYVKKAGSCGFHLDNKAHFYIQNDDTYRSFRKNASATKLPSEEWRAEWDQAEAVILSNYI